MMPRKVSRKNLLGVWRQDDAMVRLGDVIIFLEELLMQKNMHRTEKTSVAVRTRFRKLSPALTILKEYNAVDDVWTTPSEETGEFRRRASGSIVYRKQDGSTKRIREFFREKGYIPALSCKARHLHAASSFLKRHVGSGIPIAVHLKNDPSCTNCSNADGDAWVSFFQSVQTSHNVVFLLIGQDEKDERMRNLPNVIVSSQYENTLIQDLSCIQCSAACMGTASGPCNIAIVSDIPYAIFKDPLQHAEEMRQELGDADRFPFAHPNQWIIRKKQSPQRLMDAFRKLYNDGSKKKWREKIEKYEKGKTE